jgi:7,8-dihydro-6-hydroxymethylpterin-pyrophosphokinase
LACRIATVLSPEGLLRLGKNIEADMGRVASFVNGPRPIDIDILVYGNRSIESQDLTVPHPRLKERAFVLVPLAEIAPELMVPGLCRSVARLAAEVGGLDGVRKYKGGFDVPAIRGRAL